MTPRNALVGLLIAFAWLVFLVYLSVEAFK